VVTLAAVLGRSESDDLALDWEEIARLDVEPLFLGELLSEESGCTVLDTLLSSNGIGLVVVRLLSCSRMIRIDLTRLSCTTSFHDFFSLSNSTKAVSQQARQYGDGGNPGSRFEANIS
jgi:hypothetical protein